MKITAVFKTRSCYDAVLDDSRSMDEQEIMSDPDSLTVVYTEIDSISRAVILINLVLMLARPHGGIQRLVLEG